MAVEDGTEKLQKLSKRMKDAVANGAAPTPEKLTIRDFLGWYGFARRGSWISRRIRNDLESLDLRTIPDFEVGWLGATITIQLRPEAANSVSTVGEIDPTVRVGSLGASNKSPVSVAPDAPLETATTIMQLNDFSQLPVMQGSRDVKGIITWQSIGSRMALGVECDKVRNCMEPHREVTVNTPLLDAVAEVSRNRYVLVRGDTNEITGIVTMSDLVDQFMNLANPFLVIGEIEGYLRNLIHGKFTIQEMKGAARGREISGPADLTFGDYCSLLGKPERWDKLDLKVDRKQFVEWLEEVREIRNDVMHFNLDGLEDKHAEKLNGLASFFRDMARVEAL